MSDEQVDVEGAVKLNEPVKSAPKLDVEAALKSIRNFEAKEAFKLKETKPLSDLSEFQPKVVDFSISERITQLRQKLSIKEIAAGGRDKAVEIVAKLKSSSNYFEPVIYSPSDQGDVFLPAITGRAFGDNTNENEKVHVTMGDIGENVVLEEVVTDPHHPENTLDIRYWVKSSDPSALKAAEDSKKGIRNSLIKPPLVLKQLSEDDARAVLGKVQVNPKDDFRLVRLTDLMKSGFAGTVREIQKKNEPIIAGEEKVNESSHGKVRIGNNTYQKVAARVDGGILVTYDSADGATRLTKDELMGLQSEKRIGVVERTGTDVVWTLPESNFRLLNGEVGGGVNERTITLKSTPSIDASLQGDEEKLKQADYTGLILANMEQLAGDKLLRVEVKNESEIVDFGATEQQKLENRALYQVVSNLRSMDGTKIMSIADQSEGRELVITPLITNDNKSVVVLSETIMNGGTVTTIDTIRLIDRPAAERWNRDYGTRSTDPAWRSEVLKSFSVENTQLSMQEELMGFENLAS